MSYRFIKGEIPSAGLRRILLEELDAARVELVTALEDPVALHEVRKRIKRMRALVRLCREGLGELAKLEDMVLRDVGRMLAAHRESDALVEILRAAAKTAGAVEVRHLEETVRLHQSARAPMRNREADLARARRALGGLRRRIAAIEVDEFDERACLRRLRKSYRRARDQWWVAVSDPTDDGLHEWRKLTKILLNHLRLVRVWCGDELPRVRSALVEIDDRLGRARDYAHLAGILRGVPAAEIPLRYGMGLRARLESDVDDELSRAFVLGRQVFRPRAKVFLERILA